MDTKRCAWTCQLELPLSEFGVNRKYADHKSPYCKRCARMRTNLQRQGLAVARKRSVMSPAEKVINAVRHGVRTQKEIARRTRMQQDEVDGLLAELILDKKQIVARAAGEVREYFIAA